MRKTCPNGHFSFSAESPGWPCPDGRTISDGLNKGNISWMPYGKYVVERIENIAGKGENAGYQQFSPFSSMFSSVFFTGLLKVVIVWQRVKHLFSGRNVNFCPKPVHPIQKYRVFWTQHRLWSYPHRMQSEFDTRLRQTFFPAYFHPSPVQKHVRKLVAGFGKKVVLVHVLVWESQKPHVRHRPPWYDLSC